MFIQPCVLSLSRKYLDEAFLRRFGGHHHTDTGHTGKALWMLSRVARLVGDEEMARTARQGGLRLVDGAFRAGDGWWAGGWKADGSLGEGAAMWWAYAELDQLADWFGISDVSELEATLEEKYAELSRTADGHGPGDDP